MDALDAFRASQREAWAHFAPLASITTAPAARLVRDAAIRPGDRVLDVACGTGVVAVTPARLGARVIGPEVAVAEMLRVLRKGGTIAFSTWPPELFVGRMCTLLSRYAPPGAAVRNIRFDRDTMSVPSLSPQHNRDMTERTAGPMMKLVETLRNFDPERRAGFRQITRRWPPSTSLTTRCARAT